MADASLKQTINPPRSNSSEEGPSSASASMPLPTNQTAQNELESRIQILEQENQLLKEQLKFADYFRVVAEHTSNSVIVVNPDGITVWVNHSFEQLSGMARDDIIGNTPSQFLIGEETNFANLQNMMMAMKDEESFTYEVQHYHSSGQPYQIIVNGEPIYGSNGRFLGYAMFETDVTLLKIMEKSLAEAHRLAEESEASKTNFLANLSHELCTPLNGILGITQLLETTQLNSEQTEYVNTIQESGEDLLSLIGALLKITEAPIYNYEIEEVEIRGKLAKLVAQLRPECEAKGVEFNLCVAESVPTSISLPWSKLSIALIHLCDNAVKFTSAGHVNLTVSKNHAAENQLEFAVQDTGIGIPKAALPHIFDPFYQADSSHTRDFEGIGLGATIVKRTLESLNCLIQVETEEGKGSRFFFNVSY